MVEAVKIIGGWAKRPGGVRRSPVRQAHRGGPKKDRWTVKPQKESKTPEAHETAFVSSHRMSAEELAEHKEWLRKHPHVVIKPTRKDWANEFRNSADRIIEDAERFAFRQNDPARAERYDFWRELVQRKRVSARKQFPNSPALPEMPSLTGNDFYALADYCRTAADVLDGRKAPDGDGRQGGAEKRVLKHFPPGKRSKAWQELRRIVRAAREYVWVEDAYVSSDVVDLLTEDLPESAKLRVLGPVLGPVKENKRWDGALASLRRLGADLPGRVEVRESEDVHDRYIYVDGNAWRSSDSFKDMAAKRTTKITDEGELSAELVADFEKRWSSARQVYPP